MIDMKNMITRIYSHYFSLGNDKLLDLEKNGFIFVLDGLKAILISRHYSILDSGGWYERKL